ncbi:MAG: hypothetical protein J2P21_02600 [Chloracidobacterium sp.]|nr:hypothetical protein [Chloracidobacterium sp.]
MFMRASAEEMAPGGVTVSIVAMKARNGAGAKGAQEGGDVSDQTKGNKSKEVSGGLNNSKKPSPI